MSIQVTIALVGIGVGVLQGLIILLLSDIRNELRDLWERANHHSHEVCCDNDKCRSLKTGKVIVEV